jgi:ubiquinol-cytochrome c reductase cytochrome b subunit
MHYRLAALAILCCQILGLFCLLFAFVSALGGLVRIDPLWVYGPYDPVAIAPGAQPDWYLGWVEGAMRLFPAVNLHRRYLVPNVFFPGMLLPVLVFAVLYLCPFFDKLIYFDPSGRDHNVLRLPWEQPFDTAFGCAAFMFLFVASGDDVIAVMTGTSVVDIRRILRLISVTAPPVMFAVVYLLCRRARQGHRAAEPLTSAVNAAAPQAIEAQNL